MAPRCLTLLLSALLLAPASAQAAFTETPALDVTGETSCLAPTGLPGEVAIGSTAGARFLQASRTGLAQTAEIKLGEGFTCGTIVGRPSGAGLIAGTIHYDDSVVAAVRDPGGAWSAPLAVAAREGWNPRTVTGAVSDRGDVIVAWLEERGRPDGAVRIRVATRAPGQGFGPAKVLATSTAMQAPRTFDVAVTATGEAIVAWSTIDESAKGESRVPLTVAVGAPDGSFGAPVPIADLGSAGSSSLSVAKDGRAILAYSADKRIRFVERPPGGAFGAPITLAGVSDPVGAAVLTRIHDSGAAAIAWSGNLLGQVRIATRPGLGGFRAPLTLVEPTPLPDDFDPFWLLGAGSGGGGGVYLSTYGQFLSRETLALTADGQSLVGLTAPAKVRGVESAVARLATIPLAGPTALGANVGGEFDVPLLTQPLVLADGTPALTWITGIEENRFTLHLATEGGTRPAPGPAPRVSIGEPVRRALESSDPLSLRITCNGPCAVRGHIVGDTDSDGVLTLYRAGEGRLRIYTAGKRIAPIGGGTVRVRLTYGAPDSTNPQTKTISVRLRHVATPETRVVGLRAVRRGKSIRVTWRMANPARLAMFYVTGSDKRDDRGTPPVVIQEPAEGRRKAFKVTLRPTERVRYITVRMLGFEDGTMLRTTTKVR